MKSIGELERRPNWGRMLRNPVLKPLMMSAGLVVIGALAFMAVDAMGASAAQPESPSPTKSTSTPAPLALNSNGEKVASSAGIAAPITAGANTKTVTSRPAGGPSKAKSDALLAKDSTPSLMRTGMALAACVALLGGLAWWLKSHMRDGRRAPTGEKLLRVRDVLNLGPKRQVFVLSVEGRTLVVGLADQHFTLLTEMVSESPVDSTVKPDGGTKAPAKDFEDELLDLAATSVIEPTPPLARTAPPAVRPQVRAQSSDTPSPARLRLEALASREPAPSQEPVSPAFPFSREQVDRVPPKFRHLLKTHENSEGASA